MSINLEKARASRAPIKMALQRRPYKNGQNPERDQSIALDILEGTTIKRAAEKHGLSTERGRQIMCKVIRKTLRIDGSEGLLEEITADSFTKAELMLQRLRPARYAASDCETPRCQ